MSTRWVPWASVFLLFACDGGPVRTGDGGAPRCEVPLAAACATSIAADLPADVTASTAGGTDRFSGASCAEGGGAGVPDVAFEWTAPHAGRYDISTAGSGFDTVLSVRRGGCEGGEIIACNDDVGAVRQGRLTVELTACETVLIVVDGFSASEIGAVRVSIAGRESTCDDGLDNDGDGLTDCEDTEDCRTRECIEDGEWPAAWVEAEWEVLELINQARARGATCEADAYPPAGPLEMNEKIRVAARLHSVDMGAFDYFEHDSLDGRTFSDRMRDAGFGGAGPWGENLAAGQPTAQQAVTGWLGSPGHCRNLMNASYHVTGIGYAYDESSGFGHYWTQDFGGGH